MHGHRVEGSEQSLILKIEGKHPCNIRRGMLEVWGAEEHPSDQPHEQHIAGTNDTRHPLEHGRDRRRPFTRQEEPVPKYPDDEIPARAVTRNGEKKKDPRVPDGLPWAQAIAA